MQGLLSDTSNLLTKIKSTKTLLEHPSSKNSVKSQQRRRVATTASTSTTTVHPHGTANTDAQEDADWQNMSCLAALGVNEGAVAGIATIIGKEITDATLRTSNVLIRHQKSQTISS